MDPALSRFIAQYFQLVDPWDLQYPAAEILKSPTTQKTLYEQMFDEDKIDPVPPQTYRTRVLKALISKIEESLSDPDEDVHIAAARFFFFFSCLYLTIVGN